jgi:hypothetical protein
VQGVDLHKKILTDACVAVVADLPVAVAEHLPPIRGSEDDDDNAFCRVLAIAFIAAAGGSYRISSRS